MNGLRTSLWRCRRPYEAGPEDNHVSKPFFISFPVVAWKSNPWRPLRHGVNRNNYCLKGRKPVRGAKESFPGAKDGLRVERNKDGRRRIDFIGGRFRRKSAKSVCGSVCAFAFGVRKRLRYLRAVRLRPDSNDFRMRPYAPYAVPLKGKGPKRSDSQKRRIKCIRLSACALSPTDRPFSACGQKVHD